MPWEGRSRALEPGRWAEPSTCMGQQHGGKPPAHTVSPTATRLHTAAKKVLRPLPQEVIFCAGMKGQIWTRWLSEQSQTGPCHPPVCPHYTEPITQHLW